ncbi:ester cyclase [Belnapia sp. T6]|uniref:Ester cyclase n=1 Tax=Belnapia mucosa TaxID=2804532 RepID=A0ABS1UXV7_9PROT|nr:ester cyclase [Belnapia mucosa]MBL6454306.1 ester cyclase [Belnapia mucosa]
MTRDDIRRLIEDLHRLWSGGDLADVPRIYAARFAAHMPKGWGAGAPSRDGHAGIAGAILRLRAAFPDWREEVEDLVIEGDRAAVRYVSTATHTGAPFLGAAASGARIRVDEMSIFRIEAGLVAEQWCLNDDLAFEKQLRAGAAGGV